MMRRTFAVVLACAMALAAAPRHAAAGRLALDLWLDRGDNAVYQPGEALGLKTHVSEDAYLLVYEIDSQGYVNLLYPIAGRSGFAEGRRDLDIPPKDSQLDLVVSDPTGVGYIVAIASATPFREMPWYLRPFDQQAAAIGYQGDTPVEDQDVTKDGQIVGDPFVAMEKIRRQVLERPEDENSFSTTYTTYYVHERVKYPRYLCADCHRPDYWTWWPGYDPYFASCSVFDFRVNWGWYWGPSYWTGCVPYYVYVPRPDCPPGYAPQPGITYSSWLGWNKWNALWGGRLKHRDAAAPQGYVTPDRYQAGRVAGQQGRYYPPGYVTSVAANGGIRGARNTPFGRFDNASRPGGMLDSHGIQAQPVRGATNGIERPRPTWDTRGGGGRGAFETPRSAPQRYETPRPSEAPRQFTVPQRPAAPSTPRSEPHAAPAQKPAAPAAPQRPANPPSRGDNNGGDHGGSRQR